MNQVVMMNNFIGAIRSLFSLVVTKMCLRGKAMDVNLQPPSPTPVLSVNIYTFSILL